MTPSHPSCLSHAPPCVPHLCLSHVDCALTRSRKHGLIQVQLDAGDDPTGLRGGLSLPPPLLPLLLLLRAVNLCQNRKSVVLRGG